MSLSRVSAGKALPDQVNVIIEIPVQSAPVKYEVDKESGTLYVDRFLSTAMYYPCNYGYIPETLAADGDPVDVLVIAPCALLSGSVIPCRPIGMLEMSDEKGEDAKLLAVPVDKLSTVYREMHSYRDVPKYLLDSIAHFFEHYKDLEADKWVKVVGWQEAEVAKQEILTSLKRYQESLKAS